MSMNTTRKSYPSDVSDAEWEFLLPYLTLMRCDAPQRSHDLREVLNAVRYLVKTGCHWRMLPHDFPDWTVVDQQARRWIDADVFEKIAHDLRVIPRLVNERDPQPSATILDARTLRRLRKVMLERGTMEPRKRKVPRSTSRSIRWGICWR
jgi:transposase